MIANEDIIGERMPKSVVARRLSRMIEKKRSMADVAGDDGDDQFYYITSELHLKFAGMILSY